MNVSGLSEQSLFTATNQIATITLQCVPRDPLAPAIVVATTAATVPTTPTDLGVQVGAGAVDIWWTQPLDRGGVKPLPYVAHTRAWGGWSEVHCLTT